MNFLIQTLETIPNVSFLNLDRSDVLDDFVLSKSFYEMDQNVIATSHVGIVTMEGINCIQHMQMHALFLKSLKPNIQVMSLVNSMKETYFSNKVVVR